MIKRVFVFIVSLAALVSIGLVKCASSVPYANAAQDDVETRAVLSISYLPDE